MLRLPWLQADEPFPPTAQALAEPAGLLAVGADLSVARLRSAYRQGIFPWFGEGDPILWWSPSPRMVLRCQDFAPSHTLRKQLRQIARAQAAGDLSLQVRVDHDCAAVLRACAAPRRAGTETWVVPAMQEAYLAWHRAGEVHSIETWQDGQLIGGLYGVSLGHMFFGESMFSHRSNASKIALAYLVGYLRAQGVDWIDCQQQTAHLASLGAQPIPREPFLQHLAAACAQPALPWRPGILAADGRLQPSPSLPCA